MNNMRLNKIFSGVLVFLSLLLAQGSVITDPNDFQIWPKCTDLIFQYNFSCFRMNKNGRKNT